MGQNSMDNNEDIRSWFFKIYYCEIIKHDIRRSKLDLSSQQRIHGGGNIIMINIRKLTGMIVLIHAKRHTDSEDI